MTQNFVLAFGGTGARCVEAVTYLAASRVITAPMHVLVVDPDETNGNVSDAIRQLQAYRAVHAEMNTGRTDLRPFFSTALNANLPVKSFFWQNPQVTEEFASLLGYAGLSDNEQALLDLLYDESDMRMSFEKGYVGRAHIGSLDLMRTLRGQIAAAIEPTRDAASEVDAMAHFFQALRAAAQLPGGGRLLVLGSVFGGTGASGLPAMPPLLSQVLTPGLREKISVGCVQLAPYFSFPQGPQEAPDSHLHPLATQTAFFHYSLADSDYRRIYIVGAPSRAESNAENHVGGAAQRNKAHYVELAAALAAKHFFSSPPSVDGTEVLASGGGQVDWENLPSAERITVRRNLVSFITFCMMQSEYLSKDLSSRRHLGSKWMADLESVPGRKLGGQEPALSSLAAFCSRAVEWAAQLEKEAGKGLFTIARAKGEAGLGEAAAGGDGQDAYHRFYRQLSKQRKVAQPSGTGWLVEALTNSSDEFCQATYTSWWG